MEKLSKIDLANLNFLLTISDCDLLKWFEQATHDDKLYAGELVTSHLFNIVDANMLWESTEGKIVDVNEAQSYLKKFSVKS